MIKIYKKTLKDDALKGLKEIEDGSWIAVINPTAGEISGLAKKLNLDHTILEDSLDENEISRVEKQNDIFYMIMRFPVVSDPVSVSTVPLLVVITEENIITLCKDGNEIIDNFLNLKIPIYTTHKTYFLLKIIHEVISDYDVYLNRIAKGIKLKKIKIDNLENKDIIFLVQAEETLNDFTSSLLPIINTLEKIHSGRYIPMYDNDKGTIEDLVMDSKQTLEFSHSSLRSIKNIREAYSAILANDLNKVIKLLTSLTIILTVPMIISSIYGMNIALPFYHDSHAFIYIVGFVIITSFLLYRLFVKRKWL
jgi:magnesium transporter